MLIPIPLPSGDALLAALLSTDADELTIENPIQVKIHPVHGFFAKSWMLLSESNHVSLTHNDITFWGEANNKAVEYYDTFAERLTHIHALRNRESEMKEQGEEVEDVLVAYLESKDSIKH